MSESVGQAIDEPVQPARAARRAQGSSLYRLIEDFGGTLATIFAKMGFGVIIGVITARWLGPELRGIFSLVSTFPASLTTLTKFGQAQATIYFIRREKQDVSVVASTAVWFGLGTGAVLIAGVLIFHQYILSTVLRGVPLWALVAICPMIPILLMESYLYGVLQATDRFRVYNARLLGESVIALVLMATVLIGLRLGLPGALGVSVALNTVMLLWVFWTIHKDTPLRFTFDRPLFHRMLRYGMKSHLQIIASHFNFKAGVYLCSLYLTPSEVAFYSIGAKFAEQMMSIPQSLGLAMFPRLAGMPEDKVHAMTAAACRQTLAIAVLAAVVLTLVGRFAIVWLYGVAYEPAAVPLVWISWGIVMMSLYVLLSRDFTARDRQVINVIAAYIALGGNIGLNMWLIPRYGILGAAIGTSASYTAAALLLYGFFLRESGLAWYTPLVLNRSDFERWRRLTAEVASRFGKRGRGGAGNPE
ncbi:MAG TPA: flippase [Candidatus Limnocylindrales bacterium]|nr:flippase [Candidatus Limnocylindrales bacterium]